MRNEEDIKHGYIEKENEHKKGWGNQEGINQEPKGGSKEKEHKKGWGNQEGINQEPKGGSRRSSSDELDRRDCADC